MKRKLFLILLLIIMTSQTSKPVGKEEAACSALVALLAAGTGYYVWNSKHQNPILPDIKLTLENTQEPNSNVTPITELPTKTEKLQAIAIETPCIPIETENLNIELPSLNKFDHRDNTEPLPSIVQELPTVGILKKTVVDTIKKYQFYHGDY